MSDEKLELPEDITLTRQGLQIEIVHKWFSLQATCVGLFGVYIGWSAIDWKIFMHGSWDLVLQNLAADIPSRMIDLVFAYAAFWMIYFGLASVINRTWITLSREGVSVRNGPLPCPGNIQLETANLKQFFVKSTSIKGTMQRHKVQALLGNGELVTLVGGPGMKSKQAAYIHQALRRAFRTGDATHYGTFIAQARIAIRREGGNLEIVKHWAKDTTAGDMIAWVHFLVLTAFIAVVALIGSGGWPLWPIEFGWTLLLWPIIVCPKVANHGGTLAPACCCTPAQKACSFSMRCSGRLPSMIAPLMAPMDVPITHSGSTLAS